MHRPAHRTAPLRALLLAAPLTLGACADAQPVLTDDATDDAVLRQEVPTDCGNASSLRRIWLRLLQVPDGCPAGTSGAPDAGAAADAGSGGVVRTEPGTGSVTRDAGPSESGGVDPREPAGGGPSVIAVTRTVAPQPPPAVAVTVRPPTRALRPEQDGTFPSLGSSAIDVQHYDLDFVWEPFEITLDARATLTITAREAIGKVPLDFGDQLDITDVTVAVDTGAAAPARYQHVQEKLTVDLPAAVPAGTRVTLTMHYRGMPYPIAGGAPIPLGWTLGDDGAVSTISQPDAAHAWYPCNDHPTDKATFRTRITVPEGFLGISNGVQQGDAQANADGTVSYHWLMDAPMAPYLALVAIDDHLVAVEQGTTLGVKLRNYLPPGEESAFLASLGVQPDALTFLSERLGPYPFREYGAVVAQGPLVALETQGRSLFQGDSARDARTVVHELSHQWMGNSVTLVRWQSDIWWVEGFARFSEWLWVERTSGAAAYESEAARARGVLKSPRRWALTQAPAGDLFEQAIYDGGALVYHQLRAELGDATFWAAMRAFCARFQYGNASSDDLLQTFSTVSGRDVAPLIAPLLTGSLD